MLFKAIIEALFRVLFSYDCVGEECLPSRGGAIVAANHPSYLDPVLLSLQARRPIRFMAWEALFRVPILGSLIRAFGAFPVDTARGQGRSAYETARDLVESGEIVGLFPEGRRSRSGWMEPTLRQGAARLALETGAPLFPVTIVGAFRPHQGAIPRAHRSSALPGDARDRGGGGHPRRAAPECRPDTHAGSEGRYEDRTPLS